MAISKPISKEKVWETADRLRREGLPITVRSVREAIGSGSPNFITEHLRAWRRQYFVAEGEAQQDPLLSAVNTLYDALAERVGAEVRAREEKLEANMAKYEAQREPLELALRDQEAHIRSLQDSLKKREDAETVLRRERDEARSLVHQLTDEVKQLKRDLADQATAHAQTIESLHASHRRELDSRDKALAGVKAEKEEIQRTHTATTQHLASVKDKLQTADERHQREVMQHEQAVSHLRSEIATSRNEVKELAADRQRVDTDLANAVAQCKQLERELSHALQALDAEKAALARMKDDVAKQTEALQTRAAANEDRANAFEREIIKLETERDTMRSMLETLRVHSPTKP